MGKLKDKTADHYDLAYAEGYLQALRDTGWTCGDCGNFYTNDVDFCPNTVIDQAVASKRGAEWRMGQ